MNGMAWAMNPGGIKKTFPFDTGIVADLTGNWAAGIPNGQTVWVPGPMGPCLFYGVGGPSILLPAIPAAAKTPVSMTAFVYPNATGTYAIFGSASSGGIEFRINSDGSLTFLIQSVGPIASSSSGVVIFNAWSYIGLSYDELGNYAFWVNGVKVTSGQAGPFTFTSSGVFLGAGAGDNFEGYIASANIWGRRIASAEQILLNADPFRPLRGQTFATKFYLQHPSSGATVLTRRPGILTGGTYFSGMRTGGGL